MAKNIFVDAQEMRILHPDTFYAPTLEDLQELKDGDWVKVCTEDERFWCIVVEIKGDQLACVIDNDLVYSHRHGLYYGNIITVRKNNVYDIIKS
jgi:hypothetical protein